MKRTEKRHIVACHSELTWEIEAQTTTLLKRSAGGSVWNTALIEHINGIFHERFVVLTSKYRHTTQHLEALEMGMRLLGCTYNFCWSHQHMSQPTYEGESRLLK